MVMVFNATFHNISITSWRSVLLVEETGVAKETTDLPHAMNSLYITAAGLNPCIPWGGQLLFH
jgi:hypothetical protein